MIEAAAFAESVAGALDRTGDPGAALDELGWMALRTDPGLGAAAGLAAIELGRRLAPMREVDRLLGAAPLVGDLARSGSLPLAAARDGRRRVLRSEPIAAAGELDVHRVIELADPGAPIEPAAIAAWTAASVGYLAGLGQSAVEMTVQYVRQRRAFGTTLGGLAPVQQLLAGAATAVRGVTLLAAEDPDDDALAHAGPAVAQACAACHQASGAIGFTLEYPLQRYSQRARALAVWNEAILSRP